MVTATEIDNLGAVLFSKVRRALLALLYGHPGETYYLRQIVRISGLGLGPVQRELQILSTAGIVLREKRGNLVYYQANHNCPVFEELQNIVRKTFGVVGIIRDSLALLMPDIKTAFIFGSVARGTEGRASDIDLLVVGKASFAQVSAAISPAEKTIRREINPVVYPLPEFRRKVKFDHHFLNTVLHGEKIFIIGDEDELDRLVK
jgi:uncharacterized protein